MAKTQLSVSAGSDLHKGKSQKNKSLLKSVDTNIEMNKERHNNENDLG